MIYKIIKVRIMNGTNRSIKPDLYVKTKREMNIIKRYYRLIFKAEIILFDYETI